MTPEEREELDRLMVERHKASQAFQEASDAYMRAEIRIMKASNERRRQSKQERSA